MPRIHSRSRWHLELTIKIDHNNVHKTNTAYWFTIIRVCKYHKPRLFQHNKSIDSSKILKLHTDSLWCSNFIQMTYHMFLNAGKQTGKNWDWTRKYIYVQIDAGRKECICKFYVHKSIIHQLQWQRWAKYCLTAYFIFPSTFLPLLQWQRTGQTLQFMVPNTLRKMKTYYKLQNNNKNLRISTSAISSIEKCNIRSCKLTCKIRSFTSK